MEMRVLSGLIRTLRRRRRDLLVLAWFELVFTVSFGCCGWLKGDGPEFGPLTITCEIPYCRELLLSLYDLKV